MMAWFDALPLMERVFFFIALPATVILIIQTLLLFIGGIGESAGDSDFETDAPELGVDASADLDTDTAQLLSSDPDDVSINDTEPLDGIDAYGLRFITLRGLIAFFTVSGWTGILFMELKFPTIFATFLAAAAGIAAMIGIAHLMRFLLKLQSSGNINYRLALGLMGDVYLTIPPNGSGVGKVTLTLGGAMSEYDAITESNISIKTGQVVRVTDIVGDNVMVVEPVASEVKSPADNAVRLN